MFLLPSPVPSHCLIESCPRSGQLLQFHRTHDSDPSHSGNQKTIERKRASQYYPCHCYIVLPWHPTLNLTGPTPASSPFLVGGSAVFAAPDRSPSSHGSLEPSNGCSGFKDSAGLHAMHEQLLVQFRAASKDN